jgi:hypothetical protein
MAADNMTSTKPKKPNLGGRPPIDITPEQVEAAAAYSLNYKQLAAILRCHRNTIQNRMHEDEFKEAYERGKSRAESEILQLLYNSARDGNIKAQIFLAQSILGLSSRETLRHEGEVNTRFVVELPAEVPLSDWKQTFRPCDPAAGDAPGGEVP